MNIKESNMKVFCCICH